MFPLLKILEFLALQHLLHLLLLSRTRGIHFISRSFIDHQFPLFSFISTHFHPSKSTHADSKNSMQLYYTLSIKTLRFENSLNTSGTMVKINGLKNACPLLEQMSD